MKILPIATSIMTISMVRPTESSRRPIQPPNHSMMVPEGFNSATQAASIGNIPRLVELSRDRPECLSEWDAKGYTPVMRAVENDQVDVLKKLYSFNQSLLMQNDQKGFTAATKAASEGRETVILGINEINPSLLFQVDRNGYLPSTRAALDNQPVIIETLHTINPKLITAIDRHGYTTASVANWYNRQEVYAKLFDTIGIKQTFISCIDRNHINTLPILTVVALTTPEFYLACCIGLLILGQLLRMAGYRFLPRFPWQTNGQSETRTIKQPLKSDATYRREFEAKLVAARENGTAYIPLSKGILSDPNGKLFKKSEAEELYQPLECVVTFEDLNIFSTTVLHPPQNDIEPLHIASDSAACRLDKCPFDRGPISPISFIDYIKTACIDS